MTLNASPMPKNRQLPESLLAKLHGKGSMSEVLRIERERLLQQSREEMERQLSPSPEEGQVSSPQADGAILANAAKLDSADRPTATNAPPAIEAVSKPVYVEIPEPTFPQQETINAPPTTSRFYPNLAQESVGARFAGDPVDAELGRSGRLEGLSRFSRVAGDDLSDFGTIVRHSAASIAAKTWPLPLAAQQYYLEKVDASLPFTAQRNLIACVRRLTLSWGALTCQIPFELLSAASGIRNLKTLRKWLADLHARKHLKYTPVHGDLRGSLITITPPPEIMAVIEQWWRERLNTVSKGTGE
jgi:hypothetical protein